MITVAPRQNRSEDLPVQVGGLDITNETIASIDLNIEVEGDRLKVSVQGVYLGKTQDAPFENTKKSWKLS